MTSGFDFCAKSIGTLAGILFLSSLLMAVDPEGCTPDDDTPVPEGVEVIFMVDMNPGRLDDNCNPLGGCNSKWVVCDRGDTMWFVGGIHQDSPIQETEYEEQLGNWIPNTIPMYDDGTNGDVTAGDNIWTATFRLPEGMKIGYKYTYGQYQEGWTGTEEWPGNQRLLEIVDVSGDGRVVRVDEFGDETTNKDKNNCNAAFGGCKGTLTWDTDQNGDGVPDARERMVDVDNDCTLDLWPEEAYHLD